MTVGITGHQDLDRFDKDWIQLAVKKFITSSNVEKGISSLAIGADQLFVSELQKKKILYDVIIPCANYDSTFKTEKDLNFFLRFLKFSQNTMTLNFEEPSEDAFYAAGIEIVKQASTIMAIWDGKKAKGLGGTGDIVEVAIEQHTPIYHINPITKECKYLKND